MPVIKYNNNIGGYNPNPYAQPPVQTASDDNVRPIVNTVNNEIRSELKTEKEKRETVCLNSEKAAAKSNNDSIGDKVESIEEGIKSLEKSESTAGIVSSQPDGTAGVEQSAVCEENSTEKKAGTLVSSRSDSQKTIKQDELSQENKPAAPQKPKALSNKEVTEHTASLWKYLPIPLDEPEPFPEYLNSAVKYPGSRVIAARVRGKKHKHEGTNCDDWYETANFKDITFAVVSDGAGSKKYSRIGARESCKAAIGYLVSSFEKIFGEKPELRSDLKLELNNAKCMEACGKLAELVQKSAIIAHEAVEAAFYSRKTNPEYEKALGRTLDFKDFSGTLLIAVIIPVSEVTKEHLVISCQIGDGMIAILNSKGEFEKSLKLMGVPDSGDFSGETDFLTSPQMKNIETLQHRTKISRTVVDTVMVMSDGVADDYFPNETQMRRLYFDLIVNGILEKSQERLTLASLTSTQMKLFKHIPDPLIYPWVNDPNVNIPIQYTNRIMEDTGLSLADLWNDSTALYLAGLEISEKEANDDISVRLKIWLDNYVERGSFDDRTLVVITM